MSLEPLEYLRHMLAEADFLASATPDRTVLIRRFV